MCVGVELWPGRELTIASILCEYLCKAVFLRMVSLVFAFSPLLCINMNDSVKLLLGLLAFERSNDNWNHNHMIFFLVPSEITTNQRPILRSSHLRYLLTRSNNSPRMLNSRQYSVLSHILNKFVFNFVWYCFAVVFFTFQIGFFVYRIIGEKSVQTMNIAKRLSLVLSNWLLKMVHFCFCFG